MMFLTEADKGKTIDLNRGEVLCIRLFENPTTGYRWEIENVDRTIMVEQGIEIEGQTVHTPGAGHDIIFTFKVIGSGVTELQLKYLQRWEGIVENRFNILVHSHPS